MQGDEHDDAERATARALAEGDLDAAGLDPKHRLLLEYAELLTRAPYKASGGWVERLRRVGWTDPQIFEAAWIVGMFNMFDRMADAFGLRFDPFQAPRRPRY